MKTYWEADESEYVDVWYYAIIDMLLALKLIKTPAPWGATTSIETYDRLMRYKK